jgi:lipopolysaccharide export system protein LptA
MKLYSLSKMKSFSWLLTAALLFFAACSKNNSYNSSGYMAQKDSTGKSYVAVANVSPTQTSYNVFSDTTNIYTGGTLGYGSVTGVAGGNPYEMISSGNHTIRLKSANSIILLDSSRMFGNGNYYSYFVYDTGQVKTLVLSDSLNAPSSGMAKVRFLNLSPNSQTLNIWLVNTDTTQKDTVSFPNMVYLGTSSDVSADSLSSFKTIPAGSYNILLNSANQVNLFQENQLTFASGKIYTLYAKGYINNTQSADSLGLGVIRNN